MLSGKHHRKLTETPVKDRVTSFLTKNSDEQILFIELGYPGNFTTALQDAKQSYNNFGSASLHRTHEDALLTLAKEIFLLGYNSTLSLYNHPARKISLPGYQFNPLHCWKTVEEKQILHEHAFHIEWKKTTLFDETDSEETQFLLAFSPGEAFSSKYFKNRDRISYLNVIPGDTFKVHPDFIQLDLKQKEDYLALADYLKSNGQKLNGIIHAASLGEHNQINSGTVENELFFSFYNTLFIVQAFEHWLHQDEFSLTIIT